MSRNRVTRIDIRGLCGGLNPRHAVGGQLAIFFPSIGGSSMTIVSSIECIWDELGAITSVESSIGALTISSHWGKLARSIRC